MPDFPSQLKEARKMAGLSVPAAARAYGVSTRKWAYWEAGQYLLPSEKDLNQERLLKLLRARQSLVLENDILLLPE